MSKKKKRSTFFTCKCSFCAQAMWAHNIEYYPLLIATHSLLWCCWFVVFVFSPLLAHIKKQLWRKKKQQNSLHFSSQKISWFRGTQVLVIVVVVAILTIVFLLFGTTFLVWVVCVAHFLPVYCVLFFSSFAAFRPIRLHVSCTSHANAHTFFVQFSLLRRPHSHTHVERAQNWKLNLR